MPNQKQKASEIESFGRLLAAVYDTGYLSRKRLYIMSFVKGVLIGLGGTVGATLGVGLLVWALSPFDQIPLIGPLIDNIRSSVEQSKR